MSAQDDESRRLLEGEAHAYSMESVPHQVAVLAVPRAQLRSSSLVGEEHIVELRLQLARGPRELLAVLAGKQKMSLMTRLTQAHNLELKLLLGAQSVALPSWRHLWDFEYKLGWVPS